MVDYNERNGWRYGGNSIDWVFWLRLITVLVMWWLISPFLPQWLNGLSGS